MKYKLDWHPNYLLVKFIEQIDIKDIEHANKAVHGDVRTYKIFSSIWDFTDCTAINISPEEFLFTTAVDLGATWTIQEFKLAIVTADSHASDLFKSYIKKSIESGSSWEFKMFQSYDDANEWLQCCEEEQSI